MTSVILCIFIAGYALIALEGWTKVNKSAVTIRDSFLADESKGYNEGGRHEQKCRKFPSGRIFIYWL